MSDATSGIFSTPVVPANLLLLLSVARVVRRSAGDGTRGAMKGKHVQQRLRIALVSIPQASTVGGAMEPRILNRG